MRETTELNEERVKGYNSSTEEAKARQRSGYDWVKRVKLKVKTALHLLNTKIRGKRKRYQFERGRDKF